MEPGTRNTAAEMTADEIEGTSTEMDADYYRLLYDYCYWARDRLLGAMAGMSEEDYSRPNGFTYGSIKAIFTHILAAESAYLIRWQGGTVTQRITADDVPTVEALSARWREEESKARAFFSKLDDAALKGEIVSNMRDGSEFRRALWVDLSQIVIHGTQHRSEAAEALTMVGRSPGDLDLFVYMREKA